MTLARVAQTAPATLMFDLTLLVLWVSIAHHSLLGLRCIVRTGGRFPLARMQARIEPRLDVSCPSRFLAGAFGGRAVSSYLPFEVLGPIQSRQLRTSIHQDRRRRPNRSQPCGHMGRD